MMPKVKVSVALEGRGGLTGAGKKLDRKSIDPATTPLKRPTIYSSGDLPNRTLKIYVHEERVVKRYKIFTLKTDLQVVVCKRVQGLIKLGMYKKE